MRLLNISSGSNGNATYIGNDSTHLLVDAGISRKRITAGLKEADIGLSDLSAILITHEHIDHISTLGVLARTMDIPIYATEGTIEGIKQTASLREFDHGLMIPIKANEPFYIHDMEILPLRIPHDANDPVCFRFSDAHSKAAIVTDLGEYDGELVQKLKELDLLLIEANHDIRMLEAGPYPYPVKQRILGSKGHLSNENAGRLLSLLLHDHMKEIILGHISRHNNTPDLATLTVKTEIDAADNPYKADDFRMLAACQDRSTALCEV